jgi:hypothetical protein
MLRALIIALTLLAAAPAAEEQAHGVAFEKWVRESFFGGYQPPDYTQVWDIPAAENKEHGGLPANPKAIKFGTPIDLGDALRQFTIMEERQPFLLIVGFWDQEGDFKKWVLGAVATVTPERYAGLWAPITRADLEKLDAIVRDKSLSLEEARARALALKQKPPFSKALMKVNPKLDAKQRRLQCSLSFADFFRELLPGTEAKREGQPAIWGRGMPEPFSSPPRRRSRN